MHGCQTAKRTFVTKTDKKCLNKKLYLLKGLIIIKPKIGVIFPKFLQLCVLVVYMFQWSSCRPVATRYLAVYWLKKSFLSQVKDMNDRGIKRTFPLRARIFSIFCANPHFQEICSFKKSNPKKKQVSCILKRKETFTDQSVGSPLWQLAR